MRRFQFRLERVLRVRRRLEDIQKAETHAQEGAVRSLEGFREALLHEETGLRNDLAPPRGARWSSLDQQENFRYLERLIQEVAQSGGDLTKETQKLESMRAELVERSRGRRTVERLRERRFDEWRDDFEKEDRAQLDEVGGLAKRRRGEKGSAIFTSLLFLLAVCAGVLCFVVWRNWLVTGDVGYSLLRRPFDALYQNQTREQVLAFEAQQRTRRGRRDADVVERDRPGPAAAVEDREGSRRTMELIRQQQESLRRREEEVRSHEIALERSLRDFRADLNILTEIRETIDERLVELKTLEAKRTGEMSEERRRNLDALSQTIKSMREKSAADLLLAVAKGDKANTAALPFPPGEKFEGVHLVVELLKGMNPKDLAAVMDQMVKKSPADTAVLTDMLDNVKTGLEPDPAAGLSAAPDVP